MHGCSLLSLLTVFKENVYTEIVWPLTESCADWDFTSIKNNTHSPINYFLCIIVHVIVHICILRKSILDISSSLSNASSIKRRCSNCSFLPKDRGLIWSAIVPVYLYFFSNKHRLVLLIVTPSSARRRWIAFMQPHSKPRELNDPSTRFQCYPAHSFQ